MENPSAPENIIPFTMEAARPASEASRALALADPRMKAAMERLKEARGITLDGEGQGELVQEQVAFYQASVLLARIDAADPLRGASSVRDLFRDQSPLLGAVVLVLTAAEDCGEIRSPGVTSCAAEIIALVRAFDLGSRKHAA